MDVYAYIKGEESSYQSLPVRITDNWEWNMFKHVENSTNMLNSQFWKGSNADYSRPYANIVLEPMNLQKALLDFDVKDVNIFATAPEHTAKSFAMRKFHEWWARKQILGQFFNDIVDCFTDYGGVLTKTTKSGGTLNLEVVPLQRLAFCDQTDILSGPICEKHQYSPDQLREFEGKWHNIDEAITHSNAFRSDNRNNSNNKTPGHYIEVYELHGVLPDSFLDENGDDTTYSRQMHVVTYFKDESGHEQGLTLYAGPEDESPYDFEKRDPIYGRALGRGGIEELFHPQLWTNWNAAQLKSILETAGKQIFQTADKNLPATNVIKQMKSGQIIKYADGKPLTPLNNAPVNATAFENSMELWDERAKRISAAYDTVTGADTTSGMPFRLGAMLSQQGHGTHEKRREILELFMRRLYQNRILPYLAKQMQKPTAIRVVLTKDEIERVIQQVADNRTRETAKEQLLNGNVPSPLDLRAINQAHRKSIQPQDGAITIEWTKEFANDMKDVDMDVDMTITGENKNLPLIVDKLSSIFMAVAQNPAILNDATLRNIFNQILENSGLSSIDYIQPGPTRIAPEQPLPPQDQTALQPLTQ